MCESCGCGEHHYTPVELQVGGMSCSHCAEQIETGLAKIPGVERVRADHSTGKVAFVLTADTAVETVKAALEDLGFDA